MPCFLTQRVEVDLSKVPEAFVEAALKTVALQSYETATFHNGKLTIRARTTERTKSIENAVKRGISNAVLQAASKKFRWQLKATKKVNEYDVEKRGY